MHTVPAEDGCEMRLDTCGLNIIFPDVHYNIYKLAIETTVQIEL